LLSNIDLKTDWHLGIHDKESQLVVICIY
jgi:hypothetical protein